MERLHEPKANFKLHGTEKLFVSKKICFRDGNESELFFLLKNRNQKRKAKNIHD